MWVQVAEQIRSDVTAAMKAGDRNRVTALRLVLSELQKDAKEGGGDTQTTSSSGTGGRNYLRDQVTVRERHHPLDEVLERLWRAGLEPAALRGQHRGGLLDESAAEDVHHKLVVVARRPAGLSAWAHAHGMEGRCG